MEGGIGKFAARRVFGHLQVDARPRAFAVGVAPRSCKKKARSAAAWVSCSGCCLPAASLAADAASATIVSERCAAAASDTLLGSPARPSAVFFEISERADGERRGPVQICGRLETRLTKTFPMLSSDSIWPLGVHRLERSLKINTRSGHSRRAHRASRTQRASQCGAAR